MADLRDVQVNGRSYRVRRRRDGSFRVEVRIEADFGRHYPTMTGHWRDLREGPSFYRAVAAFLAADEQETPAHG